MAAYANSEHTKRKLIETAGALFAEHGVKAVTTRQIARESGENIGIIHYHFGGKDGLLEAVIDYSSEEWRDGRLMRFVEEHSKLLENPMWHHEFIGKFVDYFYNLLFSEEKPLWCGTLIFQILQRESAVSDRLFEHISRSIIELISDLYIRLTGDSDPENAYCWTMSLVSPAVLMAVDSASVKRFARTDKIPESLIRKIKEIVTVNLVAGLAILKVRKSDNE